MRYESRVNGTTGNVFVRVTVGYKARKPVRVSNTFPKGTDDREIEAWVRRAKEKGVPEKAKPLTFDSLMDEWLATKKRQVANRTLCTYRAECDRYIRGKLPRFDEVTTDDLQTLVDSYPQLSPRSIELIRTYLSMIFDYAVLKGYLRVSPVTKALIIPKRRRKRKITVLTVREFERLSISFDTRVEVELALKTLLLTGLRVSELLALEWRHLQENALTVEQSLDTRYGEKTVSPPKSDHAYRTISVSKGLSRDLNAFAERRDSTFIFSVGYTGLGKNLKRKCKSLGLPSMNLHGLRHSHCTYLLAKGVNILAVSNRAGHHGNGSFTLSTYGHLVPSMNDKILEVLDN